MRKALRILFVVMTVVVLASCSSKKVYNKQLKQVELGMSRPQVENLMGPEYVEYPATQSWGKTLEKIVYADKYKYSWQFIFEDGYLIKWGKDE